MKFEEKVVPNFPMEKQEWKDFLYITKVLTGKQSGAETIRKFVIRYNKRHKHILDKRL